MAEDNSGLNFSKLKALVTLHEGSKSHAYKDILGIITVGVGRNIDLSGPGLRPSEIDFMLGNDLMEHHRRLCAALPWFEYLSGVRQAVLIDLCHNLGFQGLMKFKETLGLIEQHHYSAAAKQLLKSKAARQHLFWKNPRYERLAKMLSSNTWPADL